MSKSTIQESEYATLWYHPDKKIVHHKWHKYIYGQEFRQVLEKGLEIFQQYGAQKWLSDDRNNSALPLDDSDWGMHDWFPRVFGAGWRYWAIVMPDKVVGQMNMQRFIDSYAKQGLTIQLFEDADEALMWLEGVD